jgi:hypothetical protein
MNAEVSGALDSEETKTRRENTIKKIINELSECNSILDTAPEVVAQIMKIKSTDLWRLSSIIHLIQTEKLELDTQEMKELLDQARVARIMEENENLPSGVSWGGTTGPLGPSGMVIPYLGSTGPMGVTMVQIVPNRIPKQIP